MAECCGLRRRIKLYWEGNNQHAKFLWCLPLAMTPIFIGSLFILMGCLSIVFKVYNVNESGEGWTGPAITMLSLNVLQIFLGLLGFFVVIRKKKALKSLKLLKLSYLIVAYTLFVIQIAMLIVYCVDGKDHSTGTWIYLSVYVGYAVLLIGLSYELNSACSSLRKVYTMGGSGWERKNANNLATLHKMRQVSDEAQLGHLLDAESDI